MALNGNSSSFTTPPAVTSDDQSTLAVTVSNSAGVVTSTMATLSVPGSPRRPTVGDLRFKDVGTFPLPLSGVEYTNILGGMSASYGNKVGTPLLIGSAGPVGVAGGPGNCSWSYGLFLLPKGAVGRTTSYISGVLSDFSTDLATLVGPNTVITSLDLFEGQDAYALQAIKTSGSDVYLFGSATVLPGELQSAISREAAIGRVITAVSVSAGQATYISYGRQGDLSTIYESNTLPATSSTVGSVATGLAQQGYVITAVGGNCRDGFLLVGTRVQGDSTPRPFHVTSQMVSDRGYTMVGSIFIYNSASPATSNNIYFYEQ
jgi:hypothetical protein